MIVSGAPVMSEKLAGSGLFDEVVEGNLAEAALAFARKVGAQAGPHPKVRDRKIEHPNAEGFIQFARNSVAAIAKNFPAPHKCIDAVEAGVKDGFDKGLAFERECFMALVQTPESRALRHAFFGERAASKIPDVPSDTVAREIKQVAVIGAGTMGGGIAMNFINAGLPVTLLETKQEALDRGIATIRKNYEATVKKGKLKPEVLEQRMALITPTLSYDDLKHADLIVEAVFEELGVKEQVFKRLDEVAKGRRDSRVEHLHARRRQDRGVHEASAGRGRHALLQPGQRDEAARSGARQGNGKRRARHRHAAGEEDQEDGGGVGCVRRLHRQPDDRAIHPPGALHA